MKTRNLVLRKTALAAAVVLLVGGVSTMDGFTLGGSGSYAWMSSAYAAEDGAGGGGHKGAMGENRGGQGGKGAGGQGERGGKSMRDVLADEADDDSDRPPFAGVPGGGGRPGEDKGSGGNPEPGSVKGDEYGDLLVLLRDPITGVPILKDGWLQACTVADCSETVTLVDGEVPEGATVFEVDFGRASVARSPASVIEHSLDEAITKLTAEGAVIGVDPAGRITITVNGITSTIDSPLENLALYIDLMEGLASESTSAAEAALGDLATLDTAASLLAGVADKTGDITLDFVAYENVIADVVKSGEYYDFTGFTYDRAYPDAYTVWYSPDGLVAPVEKTMDINDYLQLVNGDLPEDGNFAALFTAAADDALEVIELVHTQIVTDALLPEGFEFNE